MRARWHVTALALAVVAGSLGCGDRERKDKEATVSPLSSMPTGPRQPRHRVDCASFFDAEFMAAELMLFSRNGGHDSHRTDIGTLCASMSRVLHSRLELSPSFACAADVAADVNELATLERQYRHASSADREMRSPIAFIDGLGRGAYAFPGTFTFFDDDTECTMTLEVTRDLKGVSIGETIEWARRLGPSIQKKLRPETVLADTLTFSTVDAKIADVDCTPLVLAAQAAEPTFEVRGLVSKKRVYGVDCPRLWRGADSISLVVKCFDQPGRAEREVDSWPGHPEHITLGTGARAAAQELHLYDRDSDCALELSVSRGGSILDGKQIAEGHRALVDGLLKAAAPSIRK